MILIFGKLPKNPIIPCVLGNAIRKPSPLHIIFFYLSSGACLRQRLLLIQPLLFEVFIIMADKRRVNGSTSVIGTCDQPYTFFFNYIFKRKPRCVRAGATCDTDRGSFDFRAFFFWMSDVFLFLFFFLLCENVNSDCDQWKFHWVGKTAK